MTKLALVLGGHASLGAYTAGATTELLAAAESGGSGRGAPVRVITGSGWGGISAALAARSLVVNPNLVPWIERVWIDALDARHLLGADSRHRSAVLDPEPLERLTRHTVAGAPASDDRSSPAFDGTLALGLDLVPAEPIPGAPGDGATRAPAATFQLDASHVAGDPVWQQIRRATLAASAVPLALPLRRLSRELTGLRGDEGSGGDALCAGAGPSRPRPLALARRLMRRDRARPDGGWRVLVVDPDPGTGGRGPGAERREAGDPLARAVGLLLGAGLGDDIARDWGAAEDAAERTGLLRALTRRLPEIHGRMDDPDAVGLGRRIGELAERVAEREVRRSGTPSQDRAGDPALRRLDDGLQRIQAHPAYARVFDEVQSRAGRTRLAKLVYVLEALADVAGSDPARLHRIAPEHPGRLAGRGLAGYGGFAARPWRRHDFVAGRRDARRVLEEELSDALPYSPDGPDAYDPPRVTGLDAALGSDARGRLRSRLDDEADRLLDRVEPGGLRGLFYRLARSGLRKRLRNALLDAMEAGALA